MYGKKIQFVDPYSGQRLISCDADVMRVNSVSSCEPQTIESAIGHTTNHKAGNIFSSCVADCRQLCINFCDIKSPKTGKVHQKKYSVGTTRISR